MLQTRDRPRRRSTHDNRRHRPRRTAHGDTSHDRIPRHRRRRLPGRPRLPAPASRGLRHRLPRLPLAAARRVQLGARPLRRDGPRQRRARAVDRRRERAVGPGQLRAHGRALGPGRQLAARPRRRARRSRAAAVAQRGRAVGVHARLHEAGRGDRAHHHAGEHRRPRRPLRPRRRQARDLHRLGHAQVRCLPWRLHAHRGRRGRPAARGLAGLRRLRRGPRHVRARRADAGRRPAVPVLHLGHHVQAQARAAQPPELPRGASVDDVLDRPEAGRRALEHQLAGLGQACVELLLRAVERGRDDLHLQLRALQRAGRARRAGQEQGHLAVRAAHRVAHADAAGSRQVQDVAARAGGRRRAAEPRGDRHRAARVGHHDPRRLRADRDDRAGGQSAGPEVQARLDGPAAAGLRRGAAGHRRPAPRRKARSR